jgi:hypothetical protein
VLEDAVSGESTRPSLQKAAFLLCPCMAQGSFSRVPFHKGTTPLSGPNHLPKASPPNTIPLGMRASKYEFGDGEDTNIPPTVPAHDVHAPSEGSPNYLSLSKDACRSLKES